MSKKKIFRKPKPQPPKWFWLDIDGCWDCNCGNNCKRLKEMRKIERDRRERKEKQKIQSYY